MIPKIIWQTHEVKYDDLKDFQKNVTMTWINLNPSYKYIYADADQRKKDVENFDKKIYESYIKEPKITQADMWRYIMLYQHGGVYADMDSVCTKPLDDFINESHDNKDMICTHIDKYTKDISIDNKSVNNSNFCATKNSLVLKEILEDIGFAYRMLREGYIEGGMVPLKYSCWNSFSNNVLINNDKISFDFNCAIHDRRYKSRFQDYVVNYDGKEIMYSELANMNNWTIY